jgi:hypothetical protein
VVPVKYGLAPDSADYGAALGALAVVETPRDNHVTCAPDHDFAALRAVAGFPGMPGGHVTHIDVLEPPASRDIARALNRCDGRGRQVGQSEGGRKPSEVERDLAADIVQEPLGGKIDVTLAIVERRDDKIDDLQPGSTLPYRNDGVQDRLQACIARLRVELGTEGLEVNLDGVHDVGESDQRIVVYES